MEKFVLSGTKVKNYRSFESKAEKDSHIGDQFKTLRSRSECKKKRKEIERKEKKKY